MHMITQQQSIGWMHSHGHNSGCIVGIFGAVIDGNVLQSDIHYRSNISRPLFMRYPTPPRQNTPQRPVVTPTLVDNSVSLTCVSS